VKSNCNIFFVFLIIHLVSFEVPFAQSSFNLTAEFVDYLPVNDTVILKTTSNEIRDTLIINSSKFVFEGYISEPSDAFIITSQGKYYLPLVNDDINLKIINNDSLDIHYSRSRIYENLTGYYKETNVYVTKYQDIGSKYSEEFALKTDYQQDSLAIDFMQQVYQKYKQAKDIDGLALITDDLAGLIGTKNHPELILELYSLLPDSLQNGYSGKRIKLYLDQNYKINEGQNVDFQFEDISGHFHSLNDYSGKYILLEFWASWCGPCIMQIPFLKSIYNEHSDKIEIISISIDKDLQKWQNKVAELDMEWINIHYKQDDINLEDKFYIRGVPYNILLSKEGKIIKKDIIMGDLDEFLK